jgi:predicted ATPase
MLNNWYVITGGPCSGKTTIINLLRKKGHKIQEETARLYFLSQMKLGFTNEQIRANPQTLQDNIVSFQIEKESRLNVGHKVFLDRALPDCLAYYNFLKLQIPQRVADNLKKPPYKQVFFLEGLPFKKDKIRNESPETSIVIENHLWKAYIELGYKPIKVPLMRKEERVDFILSITQ